MEELNMEAKVYEPFPAGSVPEGWPKEYVSKVDYIAALADIDELQKANRDWALSDAKMCSGWFIQRVAELEAALLDLYSGTAEYVYLNHLGDPNNTTPMRNAAKALGAPALEAYDRLRALYSTSGAKVNA
jgi:hypothetical protein